MVATHLKSKSGILKCLGYGDLSLKLVLAISIDLNLACKSILDKESTVILMEVYFSFTILKMVFSILFIRADYVVSTMKICIASCKE